MRIRDLFLEKHPEKLARDNPFKGTRPFTGSSEFGVRSARGESERQKNFELWGYIPEQKSETINLVSFTSLSCINFL